MRILSFPEGDTMVTKRLVVDSQKPTLKDYKWKDTGQQLSFATRELSVAFDKEDAAFTFQEVSTGKVLVKEKEDKKEEIPCDSGLSAQAIWQAPSSGA